MPIINTLLTARDNMSGVLDNLADNANKASKKVGASLSATGESVTDIESIFNGMKDSSVDSFSDIIDLIDNIKTTMTGTQGAAVRFAATFALLAGGVTALSAALYGAISSAADYVRELGQISKATNSTVGFLQQMRAEFISTGMEIDKFGDINKDVLDHLGDGFRDGSGPADDMKALGLNVKEYNKYLNQADGGTKALIHTFFELRKSGKNMAEITNMMETLASDGSHLASTLANYGSEADALNHILNQHVGVTQDTIDKYAEWDKNISELSHKLNDYKVNSLSPVVEGLNDMLEVLKKDDWNNNDFNDFLLRANKLMESFGLSPMFTTLQNNLKSGGVDLVDYGKNFDALSEKAKNLQQDIIEAVNPKKEATGGWEKPEKDNSKQIEAQKKAAADWLAQLDMNIAAQQDKADRNYDIQLKKLDEFHKKSLISEAQYQRGIEMLNTQKQGADIEQVYQNRMERVNSQREQMLISERDYQEKLHQIQQERESGILDMNNNAALERLNYEHEQKLISEQRFQEQLLALHADYEARRKALTEKTANIGRNDMFERQANDMQKYNETVNRGIDLATGFAGIIKQSAEEGSAAWLIATIAQKGMLVAQAIMAANLAAVMAAANTPGGPAAQMAAAETIQGWGYAQAALIAAQGVMEIAGAREKGGPVYAGKTYLVGEKGPELFTVPGTGGQITSNANLQKAIGDTGPSGGNAEFTQINNINGSGIGPQDLEMLKSMTIAIVDKKILDDKRANGNA